MRWCLTPLEHILGRTRRFVGTGAPDESGLFSILNVRQSWMHAPSRLQGDRTYMLDQIDI